MAKSSTVTAFRDYHPRLLESRVSESKEFFHLSDAFKKLFVETPKQPNFTIPIAGYGGHLRGERSQNYFGKSYRDTAIKAKKLERQLHGASQGREKH
jgi:hypothetical protein